MKAALLLAKESLQISELSEIPLQPGEVRVRIEAALTCGTDLKVYKRGYHAKMLTPPCVFGHELAGVISEIGSGIENFCVNDRVVPANSAPCGRCFYCAHQQENLCDDLLCLNGAYAESIIIPVRIVQKNLLKLRETTSFADAALTEPLACVVQGLRDLNPLPGEHLLIIGSGPIGLMFARLALHLGCIVTLAGRGAERLSKAKEFGAQTVEVKPGSDGLSEITALHQRFDTVVEAVGKSETWSTAIRAVRKGGRVNLFGGCPSGTTITLDTGSIHYSNLQLLASFHHTPAAIRSALADIEAGLITSQDFVTARHPLSSLPDLFRQMAAGNTTVKTMVDVHA